MFARAVRPAARSLRLATAPRVAPAARAVRFNASQAGPNQGGSQYTSTTDGQQLLMVLLAGGALFASVSYVEKHRRTNTAPNPESSGAAEEEIDEVDEEEDAAEGQPEQGPSEYSELGGRTAHRALSAHASEAGAARRRSERQLRGLGTARDEIVIEFGAAMPPQVPQARGGGSADAGLHRACFGLLSSQQTPRRRSRGVGELGFIRRCG